MYNKIKKLYPKLIKKIFLCKYYPIDLNLFKPRNKIKLRKKYQIPNSKKVILFSAQDVDDRRKGFKYYKKIVSALSNNNNFYFLILGNINNFKSINNSRHIGHMSNKQTSEIYSLADIYISTSLIDNLPLTVLEAMSSGLPVISFNSGGVNEVLEKKFLINNKNYKKIIKMIKFLKETDLIINSKLVRQFAKQNFHSKKISSQYIKIFEKINAY